MKLMFQNLLLLSSSIIHLFCLTFSGAVTDFGPASKNWAFRGSGTGSP
jgi:hypothetical protein